MELTGKTAGAATPVKDSQGSRSKNQEVSRRSENSNPNFSPGPKHSRSPSLVKSARSQKSASKHSPGLNPNPNPNPNPVSHPTAAAAAAGFSPRNKIRERRFVIAKKKPKRNESGSGPKVACKCKDKAGSKKCLCVAYENLRASQEEFFKSREEVSEDSKAVVVDGAENELEREIEKGLKVKDSQVEEGEAKIEPYNGGSGETDLVPNQIGSSMVKRRRDKCKNEMRNSTPDIGRVMHLVKAFESFHMIPNPKESDGQKSDKEEEARVVEEEEEEDVKKGLKWALPGIHAPKVSETRVSLSSFCPSDLFLTSENLGLDPRASVSSSWDGSVGSVSSRNSNGGRRSRRNSSESACTIGGSRWKKKKLRATSQKPFKLRTEQRGRLKEEEFVKKLQEMLQEEERQRIPIAQGLPWTTDEPECLLKPPVKESTRPIDLTLHSDVRAVERAEFDLQVTEKMTLVEMYKKERERQQKMEEEEEIRRLRKESIPKAQPMPYFDRPFLPRGSEKHPTIPREPKFHVPQQKKIKCCSSWSDVSSYTSCQD